MANGHKPHAQQQHVKQNLTLPVEKEKEKEKEKSATANVPATNIDYGQYAGQGFETHTREDYAVPFLNILQTNSPLCENNADARPGMLFNTVTNELFEGKKGVVFIPAETQHVFVEWTPRDQGGGFVAIHQLDSDIVKKVKAEQEFGKYKMEKGNPKSNDLHETYYIYGILAKDDGSSEQLIIAFTSTKNKIYKQWMTKARTIQIPLPDGRRILAPLFAHRYRITSINQKNSKGSFFNYQVGYDGKDAESCRLKPTDPLFLQAVDFRELIQTAGVKVAHETQPVANADDESEVTPFK